MKGGEQSSSITLLSSGINNTLDTSGLSSYRQTFLTAEYLSKFPERASQVARLRTALDDQVFTAFGDARKLTVCVLQALAVDTCLKLHRILCSPESIAFHGTLESLFQKCFQEEIRRLGIDTSDRPGSIILVSPTTSTQTTGYEAPQEQQVLTPTGRSFAIPHFQVGQPALKSPASSPRSLHGSTENILDSKQTPLQRHLAHLARHGLNGVSSGSADHIAAESISGSSPHGSFVNVGSSIMGVGTSAASVTSNLGTSIGSIKGRFSRLGNLSFGRRDN